jgi:hypothetical protein
MTRITETRCLRMSDSYAPAVRVRQTCAMSCGCSTAESRANRGQ